METFELTCSVCREQFIVEGENCFATKCPKCKKGFLLYIYNKDFENSNTDYCKEESELLCSKEQTSTLSFHDLERNEMALMDLRLLPEDNIADPLEIINSFEGMRQRFIHTFLENCFEAY